MTPALAVVICTRDRPADVARLLAALDRQTTPAAEVIVVDGSDDARALDATAAAARARGHRHVRVPPMERGLTRQRNAGIALATADAVLFLDDDTVPEPDCLAALAGCLARHPDAAGAGAWVTGEGAWAPAAGAGGLAAFRYDGWQRRDDVRWRVRRALGLAPRLPPGRMPPWSHGRPTSFLPPTGADYPVDFLMGCAMAFRREVLARHAFSRFFDGYGLYEDLEYCLRVRAAGGRLVLCTAARVAHLHAPPGRPAAARYGRMVVRNGWYVWRRFNPRPTLADRARWWSVSLLLAACRAGNALTGPARGAALAEAGGRLAAMAGVLALPPETADA